MKFIKKIKGIVIVAILLATFLPAVSYADNVGEKRDFYVDPSFDLSKRNSVNAVLLKVTNKAYFYGDLSWWNFVPQNDISAALGALGEEFDNKIYPALTSDYGSEWTPGIDGNARITVLIHPMAKDAGGYFRSNDEYSKLQVPGSNEREMVYINSANITGSNAKSFLAHEFTHLITFNQKDKIYGLEEETWLNEARAEYSSTLLGYDSTYEGSYLENRVLSFSDEPFNSITEWDGNRSDYGAINLFAQYLVDHYGKAMLVDSLKNPKVGIDSINAALAKGGSQKTFSQIFTDWTIALFVNDCSLGANYCYVNKNLKDLHIYPKINFLPLSGQSTLSVTDNTKAWAGNWFKVIGGQGNIKLNFVSNSGTPFVLPYLVQRGNGSYALAFLSLDSRQSGEINVSNFGTDNTALVIIPSVQNKLSNFEEGQQPSYSFTFTVSTSGTNPLPPINDGVPAGFSFQKSLSSGVYSQDVVYLKILLAREGCLSGVANTSYFASKTLAAVKCLQNRYRQAISIWAGYQISATGFVGAGTRMQLNALLGK